MGIIGNRKTSWTPWGLNSVYMKDSITGWAVGDYGTILKYDGKQWKQQNSGITTNLNSSLFSE